MITIEEGSGNVYADLGVADADDMLIKARLAAKITEIVKQHRWTQQEAAAILGVSQPKLSNLMRGQFRGISETRMLEYLARLGRRIQIVVGPAVVGHAGSVEVVFS